MDLPTRLDLYAIGAGYIQRTTQKIEPTMPYVLGSDANMYVGSITVVADAIVRQIGYNLNRLLLDGAEDTDLDRYALDRYQLTRKGASPALGAVTFSRPTFAAGAGTVPIGTQLTTLTGVQYVTTSVATFNAFSLQATANVQAMQAGKSTQVGANAIRRISQPALLFDTTLSVNNPLTTAGGEDSEDDETFRNRIRNFWNTVRRGTLGAIEQGALSVPGVVSAMAVEALSGSGLPARVVNLYIADSSGVASAALAAQVYSALGDYRAGGISVIISTSIPLLITIQLALAFQAGVNTITLSSQVQAAVFSFVNSLPVNGTLQISDLNTVLTRFKQAGVIVQTPGSIVAPAGDLVPPIGQTIRVNLSNILITPLAG